MRYAPPDYEAGKAVKETDAFVKLTRDYVATVTNIHLRHINNERFNPRSPYTHLIGQYSLGPIKRRGFVPATAIIDNDGVLTAKDPDNFYKTISVSWLDALQELSGRIKRNYGILLGGLNRIMEKLQFFASDYSADLRRLANDLNRAGVTKEIHERSIPIAVKNAVLAPGALEAVNSLKYDLGMEPAQCSGTPQDILETFGSERLMIAPKMSEGTRFEWSRRGELADIWSNVGWHKIKSRDILLNNVGCSSDLAVYPTDKAEDDDYPLVLNAGLGLVFYVKRRSGWFREKVRKILRGEQDVYEIEENLRGLEGFEGKIVVASEAFAEDFTKIIRPTEIWMYSRILTSLYENPDVYLDAVENMRKLGRLGEEARGAKGNDFYKVLGDFRETAERLRRDPVVNFITQPFVAEGLDRSLSELDALVKGGISDMKRQKSLTVDILNDFEQRLIEFDDRDLKDVTRLRDLWHERFEGRRWIRYGI